MQTSEVWADAKTNNVRDIIIAHGHTKSQTNKQTENVKQS